MKKILFCITALLVAIGIGLSAYLFTSTKTQTTQHIECRQHEQGCLLLDDGEHIGQLIFAVNQEDLIQPFRAEIHMDGAEKAGIEITGVNYYMGYNHYSLRKKKNRFIYTGVLPTCIYRSMHWQVKVTVERNQYSYTALYDFFIERDIDELT